MKLNLNKIRGRVDKLSNLLPVFCFIGSFLVMSNIVAIHEYKFLSEDGHYTLDWMLLHFFDTSFLLIVLMFAKSKNYNWFQWTCYNCVVSMWLLNLIYVSFGFAQDVYYSLFILLIYMVFVICCIFKITK